MEEIEDNGNGHSEAGTPEKSLFRIGEVSRVTATKPFVLRYWETEFPMLQPVKSPKGHRLYRREDIDTVFTIKRLLYNEGFTIAGARRHLRDQSMGASGDNGANGATYDGPADTAAAGAEGHEGESVPQAPHSTQSMSSQSASSNLALLNRRRPDSNC